MELALAYIPMDRRQALVHGTVLPERAVGAALCADISGFTTLTEALAQGLGPRRGAEELTHALNRVYDALIADVDRYGGSVVGFSGDAITCWFDGDGASARAVACALAMQQSMLQLQSFRLPNGTTLALRLKTAVASGSVRRFLVGDPTIQVLDVLAGATVTHLAAAERLAEPGEVVLDVPTALALGPAMEIAAWRDDPAGGARFAVLGQLSAPVAPRPWSELMVDALPVAQLRPWLLNTVYERASAGQGEFLTELRPAVALFLRFSGIDYEVDPDARTKLDTFICQVQGVLQRSAGALIQLTFGDKGSYLYAAFGAPIAHDDDARRAVAAVRNVSTTNSWLVL